MEENRGITLIALIITIIVLLILAGISIATLTGENGILTKAETAKQEIQIADTIESARTKIMSVQAGNDGKITTKEVRDIIATYDKDYKEDTEFTFKINEDGEEYILTDKGHNILVKDIWNGNSSKEEPEEIQGYYFYINDELLQWKSFDISTWEEFFSDGSLWVRWDEFLEGIEKDFPNKWDYEIDSYSQPWYISIPENENFELATYGFFGNNNVPPIGEKIYIESARK